MIFVYLLHWQVVDNLPRAAANVAPARKSKDQQPYSRRQTFSSDAVAQVFHRGFIVCERGCHVRERRRKERSGVTVSQQPLAEALKNVQHAHHACVLAKGHLKSTKKGVQ